MFTKFYLLNERQVVNIFEALIFGLLQGLTEFLPVSSSGHLYLLEHFLGFRESNNLAFFVLLHFATLLAVLVYFWPQIIKLKWKDLFNLAIATLPIIPFTLVVKDFLPLVSSSNLMIAIMLMLTAFLNLRSWLILKKTPSKKAKNEKSNFNAFKIGIFQALAIFPGISRSGITLNASLGEKMDQEEAVNFTFLLSIPAIAGATAYELLGESANLFTNLDLKLMLVGMLAAFFSGLLALKIFKQSLKNNKFIFFAIYCGILSLSLILTS